MLDHTPVAPVELTLAQVNEYVGKQIARARRRKDITQVRLAGVVDLPTYQQIQKYESGANKVPARRLLQISRALDEPIDYFFAGIASFCDNPEHAEVEELAALLEKMHPAQRRCLLELVKSLTEDDS